MNFGLRLTQATTAGQGT